VNVELHLPDLPEVPVSVGPTLAAPARAKVAFSERLRMLLGTYLPLLLMVALAVGTWWLVKVAPRTVVEPQASTLRHEADYTLERFVMQRFDKQGRLVALVEGQQLRHFPDTRELEVDTVRITFNSPDGRVTHITARQAAASDDGVTARLEGDAKVESQGLAGEPPVVIEGQSLVANLHDQQISTDQPVRVRQGGTEFSAEALAYDAITRGLTMQGKVRAVLQPQPKRR
jgi:lipopolysaccharide export system protein LptC